VHATTNETALEENYKKNIALLVAFCPVAFCPDTPSHIGYHVEFGRFTSKDVVITAVPQNRGAMGPRLLGRGRA